MYVKFVPPRFEDMYSTSFPTIFFDGVTISRNLQSYYKATISANLVFPCCPSS